MAKKKGGHMVIDNSKKWVRLGISKEKRRRKIQKNEDWRTWSRFRLWRHQRPFWGAVFMMVAGALVLWGPLVHLPLALIVGTPVWAGLSVGSLLFVMGLLQLLSPSHALITGSVGIILSLTSVLVALGGVGIGVFFGIIGSALGIAWRPVPQNRQATIAASTSTSSQEKHTKQQVSFLKITK
jgi:Family of unknown function (DUF6114)